LSPFALNLLECFADVAWRTDWASRESCLARAHSVVLGPGGRRNFKLEKLLVLIIEDDPKIQAILDEALCDGGYEPALAASGEEAVTLLKGGQTASRHRAT
jgi:hypothetical protein